MLLWDSWDSWDFYDQSNVPHVSYVPQQHLEQKQTITKTKTIAHEKKK